jgi:putative hydrolase of the HAD superfamily
MALLALDLDDTIADREAAFLAWARAMAQRWAPDDAEAVAYLVEHDADGYRPREELFGLLTERFGLREPIDTLVADFRDALCAALPPVREDVKRRLQALRAGGWKVAVVTNGGAGGQAAKIAQLELAPLLDACCISGALGIGKPDPRIFRIAAERCGETLDGAWMVGDAEVDVVGAHRAGIASIWLHRGRQWTRDDVRPDRVADDLAVALAMLAAP